MTPKIQKKVIATAKMFSCKLETILEQAKTGKQSKGSLAGYCVNDLADLIKYTSLVCAGQFRKAQMMQSNFDTSVYEAIPDYLWVKIEYLEP